MALGDDAPATAPVEAPASPPVGPGLASDDASHAVGPHWDVEGFWNYQWHMATDEFLAAADELSLVSRHRNVAIVCAEALWFRCHRGMVADHLLWRGIEAVHLQPRPTPHGTVVDERLERYEPEVVATWQAWTARRYPG